MHCKFLVEKWTTPFIKFLRYQDQMLCGPFPFPSYHQIIKLFFVPLRSQAQQIMLSTNLKTFKILSEILPSMQCIKHEYNLQRQLGQSVRHPFKQAFVQYLGTALPPLAIKVFVDTLIYTFFHSRAKSFPLLLLPNLLGLRSPQNN